MFNKGHAISSVIMIFAFFTSTCHGKCAITVTECWNNPNAIGCSITISKSSWVSNSLETFTLGDNKSYIDKKNPDDIWNAEFVKQRGRVVTIRLASYVTDHWGLNIRGSIATPTFSCKQESRQITIDGCFDPPLPTQCNEGGSDTSQSGDDAVRGSGYDVPAVPSGYDVPAVPSGYDVPAVPSGKGGFYQQFDLPSGKSPILQYGLPSSTGQQFQQSPDQDSYYYFNINKKKCVEYIPDNNLCPKRSLHFDNEAECYQTCVGKSVCKEPLPDISCFLVSPTAWHFDPEKKECIPFDYGRCPGIYNQFPTKQKCENFCSVFKNDTTVTTQVYVETMTETQTDSAPLTTIAIVIIVVVGIVIVVSILTIGIVYYCVKVKPRRNGILHAGSGAVIYAPRIQERELPDPPPVYEELAYNNYKHVRPNGDERNDAYVQPEPCGKPDVAASAPPSEHNPKLQAFEPQKENVRRTLTGDSGEYHLVQESSGPNVYMALGDKPRDS